MQNEKEFLIEFIEIYKSFPCLWKVKSKEYSDRSMKSQAYGVLVEKWQSRDPEGNRESVVKKINSLRTAYRKELKKVIQSEKSAAGEEDVYVPHLWYYDLMHFLKDQEIPNQTKSNVVDAQVSEDETTFNNKRSPKQPTRTSSRFPLPCSSSSTKSGRKSKASSTFRATKKRCDNVLDGIGKRYVQPMQVTDKFKTIAAAWACKLRDLAPLQAIHAEKLINEIFYEAQLGNLDRSCSIQIPSTATHISPTIPIHSSNQMLPMSAIDSENMKYEAP